MQYFTLGSERVKVYRFYISPFLEIDVRKYIKKRYSKFDIRDRWKRIAALQIMQRLHDMMVRPLILSYLDDILDKVDKASFTVEIYEAIISSWLAREVKKPSFLTVDKASKKLEFFAIHFAKKMYNNDSQFLTIDDSLKGDISIRDFENAYFDKRRIGRTLLNRDEKGSFYFAHKSFYELLLAKYKHLTNDSSIHFDKSLDAAKLFYAELKLLQIKKTLKPHPKKYEYIITVGGAIRIKYFLDDYEKVPPFWKIRGIDLEIHFFSRESLFRMLAYLVYISDTDFKKNHLDDFDTLELDQKLIDSYMTVIAIPYDYFSHSQNVSEELRQEVSKLNLQKWHSHILNSLKLLSKEKVSIKYNGFSLT